MSPTENRRKASKGKKLSEEVALAVEAARGKKALDLAVLDLRSIGSFTDYFMICSGQNVRQVQAIADAIEEALRKAGTRPSHIEGRERAEWVLLDYFDFVVHVFNKDRRDFYALERLWGSAEQVTLPGEDEPTPAPAVRKTAPKPRSDARPKAAPKPRPSAKPKAATRARKKTS